MSLSVTLSAPSLSSPPPQRRLQDSHDNSPQDSSSSSSALAFPTTAQAFAQAQLAHLQAQLQAQIHHQIQQHIAQGMPPMPPHLVQYHIQQQLQQQLAHFQQGQQGQGQEQQQQQHARPTPTPFMEPWTPLPGPTSTFHQYRPPVDPSASMTVTTTTTTTTTTKSPSSITSNDSHAAAPLPFASVQSFRNFFTPYASTVLPMHGRPPTTLHRPVVQLTYTQMPLTKAKRRRPTPGQVKVLNMVFDKTFFPSTELRQALAHELEMCPRAIQVWFQNKRQGWRTKHGHAAMKREPVPLEQVQTWCKKYYTKRKNQDDEVTPDDEFTSRPVDTYRSGPSSTTIPSRSPLPAPRTPPTPLDAQGAAAAALAFATGQRAQSTIV
ncbi:uncharacterized protein SPPG_01917 [Spizellomyces punctatus DAOM BR117]|uniref:Homeobox domain-containing protein n=1 Tax=Spizellomyces punctatus (strain DAOM BR117) TaxID=645134 RepID=A0A0L0HP17_SPIPD|nr:uncharacterized protein SPPG_01917 [Spizellomyces punctatus DAOM BR117]KND02837.1 hypothetical protein SPPG_01917 [Spizellomyces punctatus DAOM BR117]|eukprot:XP_016610876.1 hypothetical protein SPPG_01917 [Spizellomyces punctatus DAOM BR117]